jgi:hypothetical protein
MRPRGGFSRAGTLLRAWIDQHPDVKLQWHHLPLAAHEPDATLAAVVAECAGRLGGSAAFWNMIEALLFRNDSPPGSNTPGMNACKQDHAIVGWVLSQAADAMAQGIQGTPTMRISDAKSVESVSLQGPISGDALLSAIDLLIFNSSNQP